MNQHIHKYNQGPFTPLHFKRHKIIKIIQLIVEGFIAICYFTMIMTNSSVMNVLFTNRPVFYLSFFMWILLLVCFAGGFYDFYTLQFALHSSEVLNQIAYVDSTTGIANRNSCDDFLKLFKTPESTLNIGCAVIVITNLSSINYTFGHEKGNEALKALSNILEETIETLGFVGRNGSNDFLTIIDDCDEEKMDRFLLRLDHMIQKYNETTTGLELCIKHSYALNQDFELDDVYDLIRATYHNFFQQSNTK